MKTIKTPSPLNTQTDDTKMKQFQNLKYLVIIFTDNRSFDREMEKRWHKANCSDITAANLTCAS